MRLSGGSLPPHLPLPDDLLAGTMYQPVCLSGMLHQPLLPHLLLSPLAGQATALPHLAHPGQQYHLSASIIFVVTLMIKILEDRFRVVGRHEGEKRQSIVNYMANVHMM